MPLYSTGGRCPPSSHFPDPKHTKSLHGFILKQECLQFHPSWLGRGRDGGGILSEGRRKSNRTPGESEEEKYKCVKNLFYSMVNVIKSLIAS